ncbi:MAG: D-alanyl-D-alanine carboxypeptidase/D-alanyl-D-alanine-endopeptidase [Ignavibacteria bacterium]|nr:D-alanyl-D-alanine carboxypeptidase/D-alanyl-D-alanine-endopeptidase [Ignavibacteria bacterium]
MSDRQVILVFCLFLNCSVLAQIPTEQKGRSDADRSDSVITAHNKNALKQLREDVDAMISVPDWKQTSIGISIVTTDERRVLYEHDADKSFVPASVQKLFTTAAALETLGADFQFITTLYLDGVIQPNGEFEGNIIIRGSGDPSWSSLYSSSTSSEVETLVDIIDSLGIRSIRGTIIGDDDVFDNVDYGPGWGWDDLTYSYAAPVGGLNISDNSVHVTVEPPESVYDDASIKITPQTDYVRVINALRAVDSTGDTDVQPYRELRTNIIDLSGTIECKPYGSATELDIAVDNPTLFFLSACKDALVRRGIRVKGSMVDVDDWNGLINYDNIEKFSILKSKPLREIVTVINHESHNLGAEILLKTLGAHALGEGSFVKGAEAVLQWLQKQGILTAGQTIVDGSGLSRLNLCTPNQLTSLLATMSDRMYTNDFKHSLAAPGEFGTMKKRLLDTKASRSIRAKTGSMNNVSTFSGYINTRSGEQCAFAIMLNGVVNPQSMARNLQDLICMRLSSLFLLKK